MSAEVPTPVVELQPVGEAERMVALDVLRGVAVLGILVMNIKSFGVIMAAYMNPTAYGDLTGVNYALWLMEHLLADQKFMSIFSILFGAGIVLMSERAEAKGGRAAGLHYRRMAWLLLIGLLHAHLLWFGDILFSYAICGMLVYPMRRLSTRVLVAIGCFVFMIPVAFSLLGGLTIPHWPAEAIADMRTDWAPAVADVDKELAIYRGGWLAQMKHRVPTAFVFETLVLIMWVLWRAASLMLFGMVLYRLGVLTGKCTSRVYALMLVAGLALGLGLTGYGITRHEAGGWAVETSMLIYSNYNSVGSVFTCMAWIGVVMLAYRALAGTAIVHPLAAVGRTALSCYLLETIICTTIFYGHGLGLFGKVDRVGQMLMVLGVWAVLLVAAPIWLRFFRYGPFEWLWRSLAYARVQPMRR